MQESEQLGCFLFWLELLGGVWSDFWDGNDWGEACLENVAETARCLTDAPSTFLLSHRTLALLGMAGYSGQRPQVLASLAARFDPVTKSWPIRCSSSVGRQFPEDALTGASPREVHLLLSHSWYVERLCDSWSSSIHVVTLR